MSKRAPNIVMFLTDDHGAWASAYAGNSELQTPMLDQMAKEGVCFRNAFTPTPVCSPARANLLTGLTASQVGIHDWLQEWEEDIGQRDWLDGTVTLFDLFHAAGYSTALCGKWHLGRSHLPPRAADYHFGLPGWQGRHNEAYAYVDNGEEVTLTGNKSGFITDHAIEFLDGLADERPFFLNVGYIVTHSPYGRQHHGADLTGLYEDATFRDIPPYERDSWARDEDGPGDPHTDQSLRDRYIGYYAAVTEIDRSIQRIVDKVRQMGQLDNTLFIYTSDHGCALGHHGIWGKGNSTRPLNMYDISLRIPLLWWGSGVEAGQVRDECVDHYDTFMTLVERCGLRLKMPTPYPGQSYLPLLRGEKMAWDNTRFGEYGDLRMVRTPRWKLVHRYPDGPHDLFDLEEDPDEQHNLFGKAATASVAAGLKKQLDVFYATFEDAAKSGLRVKEQHRHSARSEAWRDGLREARGLQID